MAIQAADEQKLSKAAKTCLAQAVEVPGAPLFHMGNIAVFNSKSSFDLIQSTINYLTCKAQVKMPFSADEKEFLVELYESFWWGGHVKGMPEAAKLANHYVHGKGEPVAMDPLPYQHSVVVQDTMQAMKSYIRDLANRRQYFSALTTEDFKFRQSRYFKPLMLINGSRDIASQGYVRSSGLIYTEERNPRLKYADNRFYLTANTSKLTKAHFHTWWSVKNRFDFESFSKGDKFTELPVGDNKILLLPDGLSEYMDSGLKIAKPFDYEAKWTEQWQ